MNARLIVSLAALAAVHALADTAAVLPFWNTSTDVHQANLDWIGESIAETIRDALESRGVLTLERPDIDDSFHRLGLRERTGISEGSIIKIGEDLDAEQVVFGTFTFTPEPTTAEKPGAGMHGSLNISARILDLKRLRLAPEFNETGSLEDLATLQAHLAWRALALLAPKLAPPESEFRTVRAAVRLDAEENYVRGVLARDSEQKEKFFLQAARLDPHFEHPCYQLGQIYYRKREYREAAEWLSKVSPDSPHYREAEFLLGLALFESTDYSGAQKAFQTIAETVPLSEVFNNLGAAESRRNLPQAVDDFKKAADGDPHDADYRFNLGYVLWKKGDFAAAAEHFRAVLAQHPDDRMAALLAERCARKQGLTVADARLIGLERLKTNYEERAYWQLKMMLEPKAP
jgi:tetratricopeptide (TPR) repeat protein